MADEDDYMSMTIVEPVKAPEKETYTQRRIRKEREAEAKGRIKSKKELAAEAAAARDAGLATALPTSSKGFQMMAKLGFQPGSALGRKAAPPAPSDRATEGADYGNGDTIEDSTSKNSETSGLTTGITTKPASISARIDPITLDIKEDRGGIGLHTQRKRKIRDETAEIAKRAKADEGDFRERIAREREERRLEGLVGAAMRVAERMDEQCSSATQTEDSSSSATQTKNSSSSATQTEKPSISLSAATTTPTAMERRHLRSRPRLREINVLYRALARDQLVHEQERRARYDLIQSLPRNADHGGLRGRNGPTYDHTEDDEQDRLAYGSDEQEPEEIEEDPELETFLALPPAERLEQLVQYLRDKHHYCFWCKLAYPDASMEGCPGPTEDDHD